jgi:GNAT superfamily N-acetyltransferase
MVIANIGGPCVGYAYAFDDPTEHGVCALDDVVVAPRFRGAGVGHALVAELAAWCVEDGRTRMWGLASGHTDADGGLRGWYSRMGFEFDTMEIAGGMTADLAELAARTARFRVPVARG